LDTTKIAYKIYEGYLLKFGNLEGQSGNFNIIVDTFYCDM